MLLGPHHGGGMNLLNWPAWRPFDRRVYGLRKTRSYSFHVDHDTKAGTSGRSEAIGCPAADQHPVLNVSNVQSIDIYAGKRRIGIQRKPLI